MSTYADLIKKGDHLVGLDRFDEAVTAYDEAIGLNPNDANAWRSKGWVLMRLGRDAEALQCYDKALEIDPRSAEAWYRKGLCLRFRGRDAEALTAFDEATKLNPKLDWAWGCKGEALVRLGRFDEALTAFDEFTKVSPNDANAWRIKGEALVKRGRHAEAIVCYDKLLEIYPRGGSGYEEAWTNKGDALHALERDAEAVVCYDKALGLNPELDRARKGRMLAAQRLAEAMVGEVNNMDEAQRESVFCSGEPYRFIREDGTDAGIECRPGLEGLALGLMVLRLKDADLLLSQVNEGSIFKYIEHIILSLPADDPVRMKFAQTILNSSLSPLERCNAFSSFMGGIRHFWKEVYTHDEARSIVMEAIRSVPGILIPIADEVCVRQRDEVTAIFDREFAPRLGLAQDRPNPDKTIIDANSIYSILPLYVAIRYRVHVTMLSDFLSAGESHDLTRWLVENGFLQEGDVTIASKNVFLPGVVDFAHADAIYYSGMGGYDYTRLVRLAFLKHMKAGSKLVFLRDDRNRFPAKYVDAEILEVKGKEGRYPSAVFTKKVDNVDDHDPERWAKHFASYGLPYKDAFLYVGRTDSVPMPQFKLPALHIEPRRRSRNPTP
jgi:tetratricopeptide (TPR) repeat protein